MMRYLVIVFGGSCLVLLSPRWDVRGWQLQIALLSVGLWRVCCPSLFTLFLDAIDGYVL